MKKRWRQFEQEGRAAYNQVRPDMHDEDLVALFANVRGLRWVSFQDGALPSVPNTNHSMAQASCEMIRRFKGEFGDNSNAYAVLIADNADVFPLFIFENGPLGSVRSQRRAIFSVRKQGVGKNAQVYVTSVVYTLFRVNGVGDLWAHLKSNVVDCLRELKDIKFVLFLLGAIMLWPLAMLGLMMIIGYAGWLVLMGTLKPHFHPKSVGKELVAGHSTGYNNWLRDVDAQSKSIMRDSLHGCSTSRGSMVYESTLTAGNMPGGSAA